MTEIFNYNDYRAFIREILVERKSLDPSFTHRHICSQLGLKTSNFIMLVSQGKRNLTSELAQRFATLFNFTPLQSEYFLWLVLFNQSSTILEKDEYWRRLLTCKSQNKTSRLNETQYEYYSHWYNPVIRELVAIPGLQWDARSLSKALKPKVPAVQVRHSLELLERLGLIRRDGDTWTKVDLVVATPAEVHSVAVFNYHRELIGLAKESLEQDSGSERNFSAVTLEMNAEEYKKVVEMLTKFRRDALGVCGSKGPADRVYQLNLQMFPVTQSLDQVRSETESDLSEGAEQ